MPLTIVTLFDQILTLLTIIGQIIIAAVIISIIIFRKRKNPLLNMISKNGTISALVVAIIATAGSLFYSEVAGYTPCTLCWYQRILMYPQVILLSVAFLTKDKKISNYILPISVLGAIIAAYHYLLQVGVAPAVVCSAVGYSDSCSQTFVLNYGYITIPMMSLTAFSMIIAYMLVQRKYSK